MSSILFTNCENLQGQEVKIKSGANVSEAFDTQGLAVLGIMMPAAWDAANLGYDVSLDNVTWVSAYDPAGGLEQTVVQASAFVCIPIQDAIFAPFIRAKSVVAGTNTATNQTADRTLKFILRRFLGGS